LRIPPYVSVVSAVRGSWFPNASVACVTPAPDSMCPYSGFSRPLTGLVAHPVFQPDMAIDAGGL